MPTPTYNYGAVGTGQFDSADPSVMGRVTGDSGPADIDHVNIWMRSRGLRCDGETGHRKDRNPMSGRPGGRRGFRCGPRLAGNANRSNRRSF
jgi:hypothetical protein